MARQFDGLDRRLLGSLQDHIPAVDRPFAELGRRFHLEEADVIERIQALKCAPHPVIRQISAIFDSKALGYASCLVAARIADPCLDQAAAQINAHPGVSHNYRREHIFNLWYTLAVGPESCLGLERTVQELHCRSGALSTRMLPTLRLFKIGVRFDLGDGSDAAVMPPAATVPVLQSSPAPVTEADKRMIRVLQQDLPLASRPFELLAQQAGVPQAQLLEAILSYKRDGRLRRFAAVLHHREVGFSANGMGVWAVPAAQVDAFGAVAAAFPAVSHCYLRPTYEDWPYNIFTMVHAPTRPACEQILAKIGQATGVAEYRILYSTHEYKKVRVKYFTDATERWEASVGENGPTRGQGAEAR